MVTITKLPGQREQLFEDDRYLYDRLVVPTPDRPEAIASYARRALEERESIIEAYSGYAPRYVARAKASVEAFIRG